MALRPMQNALYSLRVDASEEYNTVMEAVIKSLQFSTTLLVLVIFFNNHGYLHPELNKISACEYHNESVKIVYALSNEN